MIMTQQGLQRPGQGTAGNSCCKGHVSVMCCSRLHCAGVHRVFLLCSEHCRYPE
jgi:hypothetical protein